MHRAQQSPRDSVVALYILTPQPGHPMTAHELSWGAKHTRLTVDEVAAAAELATSMDAHSSGGSRAIAVAARAGAESSLKPEEVRPPRNGDGDFY